MGLAGLYLLLVTVAMFSFVGSFIVPVDTGTATQTALRAAACGMLLLAAILLMVVPTPGFVP